jgi:hypothetical protein
MQEQPQENQLTIQPEITEIAQIQTNDSYAKQVAIMPEHGPKIQVIKEGLPEVVRATSLFFKTQSQFMDNMLTVTAYTPLRNLRQILAEMNKTREAIKEAHFNLLDKQVDVEILQRDMEKETDELKRKKMLIEIKKTEANAESTRGYISGAIRKLTNYTEQYNMIMEQHKLHNWNEADFEKEEERYHIMKAFEQAMCAARSRGGLIDEGNMIYLTQLGINGAGAQREINEYLALEQALLNDRDKEGKPAPKEPTHKMFMNFLNLMADKYAGCAVNFAKAKGMSTVTQTALIQKGNTTLIESKD